MNPRRPTPAGLEPAPFDLARAPPRPLGQRPKGVEPENPPGGPVASGLAVSGAIRLQP